MKMTFNLNKFCYGVRQYKDEFEKRIHDNTTIDSVTVTSSNTGQNDETTIRIFKILKRCPIFLTMKMTLNLNTFWHGVR